jgi:hypothetical protein
MLFQEIIYYFIKVLSSSSGTFGTFCIGMSLSVICHYLLFVGGVLVCNFVAWYIYIYIYIYVCVCVCIHTYIHIYIYVCMKENKGSNGKW